MKHLKIMCLLMLLFSCKEKKMQPTMDMQTVTENGSSDQEVSSITLSDQQIQLGNIQLDTIGNRTIGDQTVLTATLNIDETKSSSVNARISGRIEKLYFKNTGEYIKRGERLYDLYSEELNNAKQQYLLFLEKQKLLDNSLIDFNQLIEAAKNKLLLWGMNEEQISALAKAKTSSPVTVFYSTASGFITAIESHEGDYITEGTTILRVADLSSLWAEAQAYTTQLAGIDRNASATVEFPEMPGKILKGKIELMNPEVNPDSRTNLIRVSVSNSGNQLKPGMPAYVVLMNRKGHALTLPSDALIRNAGNSTVWLLDGHNSFKNKQVETGIEDEGFIEIKAGLKPGDIVVSRGAYLLNSEYIFKRGAEPQR